MLLAPDFEMFEDAKDGPMKPGDVGVIKKVVVCTWKSDIK